jgi:hypothetical protein
VRTVPYESFHGGMSPSPQYKERGDKRGGAGDVSPSSFAAGTGSPQGGPGKMACYPLAASRGLEQGGPLGRVPRAAGEPVGRGGLRPFRNAHVLVNEGDEVGQAVPDKPAEGHERGPDTLAPPVHQGGSTHAQKTGSSRRVEGRFADVRSDLHDAPRCRQRWRAI